MANAETLTCTPKPLLFVVETKLDGCGWFPMPGYFHDREYIEGFVSRMIAIEGEGTYRVKPITDAAEAETIIKDSPF
jgi:hypothetical protein